MVFRASEASLSEAIYAHASEADSTAIARQIRDGQEYALRIGLASPAVFYDGGLRRSGYVVITSNLSRISRQPMQLTDRCDRVRLSETSYTSSKLEVEQADCCRRLVNNSAHCAPQAWW